MVEGYRQRVYNEDMLAIDRIGGMTHLIKKISSSLYKFLHLISKGVHGLLNKLKTSIDKGLDPTDFIKREE